ncbi:MAG: TIGR03013 family XrtA/PEP-CTERM system glycosyltransferase [Syntrophales bacterium]
MIKIFNQYVPGRKMILFGLESLFILVVLTVVSAIRMEKSAASFLMNNVSVFQLVLVIVTIQVSLYYFDLYDFRAFRSNIELMIRLLQSLGAATIVLAIIYFSFPGFMLGRGIFAGSLLFIAVSVVVWRSAYNHILKKRRLDQNILVVGSGPLAKNIAAEIIDRADTGFKVIGFISKSPERIGEKLVNPSIIGDQTQIVDIAVKNRVSRIVVAFEDRRAGFPLEQLLDCRMRGIAVEDGIEFYEHLTGKLKIENLRPSFLIFSGGFRKSRFTTVFKKVSDFVLAGAALTVLLPLIAAVSVWIKIDSSGPVFYRQERVGEGGKLFKLLKFRSMVNDAESCGPVWAKQDDPRVTRAGKWLRKLRLDEIPQMINVLRGEMAFVGPRPERLYFVETLRKVIPFYDQRFCVAPGITGWAQVKYRYGSTVEDAAEKLRYDLYYIKNMSLTFDVFIIFETLKIVLFGKGAR